MHVISVPWLGTTPISEGLVLDTLLPKELIRIMVCIQGSNSPMSKWFFIVGIHHSKNE